MIEGDTILMSCSIRYGMDITDLVPVMDWYGPIGIIPELTDRNHCSITYLLSLPTSTRVPTQ